MGIKRSCVVGLNERKRLAKEEETREEETREERTRDEVRPQKKDSEQNLLICLQLGAVVF